jgi:tetratricopeptide (TPR) repeat protein
MYDAFLSYSHLRDEDFAQRLQKSLQRLGKAWWQRRAIRVFRDETSQGATFELWPSLERALGQSRFLVLCASPEAAKSQWVRAEVSWWVQHKGAETLLIALTDGILSWDATGNDFEWTPKTPLPSVVKGVFGTQPKWIDFRVYRTSYPAVSMPDQFLNLTADLAATIRGVPRDDLLSEELRQQRRALRLAYAALAVVAALAVLAFWERETAVTQRARAEQTLVAATQSADDLTKNVALKLRDTAGIPVDVIREILQQVQALQDQLIVYNDGKPELEFRRAVSRQLIAQTLLTQGDSTASLAAANEALSIVKELLTRNPNNQEWLRELSLIENRMGDARSGATGSREALAIFDDALQIRLRLAHEVGDARSRRDLAVSYERVGDELLKLDPVTNLTSARDAYRAALAIRQGLVKEDSGNPQYLSDLTTSLERQSRVADSADDEADAELAALAIRKSVAEQDPRNAEWLEALAASYDTVGDRSARAGKDDPARDNYASSLTIRRRLASLNPERPKWKELVVLSLFKLATIGDDTKARYSEALQIIAELSLAGQLSARLAKLSQVIQAATAAQN